MHASFDVEPLKLERAVFVAGLARCKKCGGLVHRSKIAPLAIIRQVFGESADAGWCSTCGDTTYFVLT